MGEKGSIGALGAFRIGIGAIVGGGFFATFGLTSAGAEGGTPIASDRHVFQGDASKVDEK
jgi:hypothetical protein